MNQRQEKIIELLRESGGWIKGKDIALVMGVSARTIRSDIEAINASLENGSIESSSQRGYHLETDEVLVPSRTSAIPQTPDQRRSFILKLLIRQKEVNVNDLPEQVFASSFTIESDLRSIRQCLSRSGKLNLVSCRNWISLQGEEAAKRRLYKELLSEEVEENFMNLDRINDLYPDFDLYEIRDMLLESTSHHSLSIRDTALSMVLMHVGIALTRLLNFNPIEDDATLSDMTDTPEYAAACDFWHRIEKRFPTQVPEAEIRQMALLLMGKGSGNYYEAESISVGGRTVSLWKLTRRMLEEIRSLYGVDMTDDYELRHGLSLHLRSLILRMQQGAKVENVYLEELRWRFPLIYDMGVTASRAVLEILGVQLDSNEIGFLSLHLGAAYTRARRPSKYRAVVLFPSDQALSGLVLDKIRSQFGERMEIVGTLSAFEEKKVRALAPDLILTTLPVSHDLKIPTVSLSIFYSQENESQIFQQLSRMDKERQRDLFQRRIRTLIQPEFFHEELEAADFTDAVRQMCAPLEEKKYIPETYADAVLERESYAPTSFSAGFALPHALNVDTQRSAISVAHLKTPVKWGDYSVDFVLLLAIREEDRELLGIFFDWWIQIISDPLRFGRLKEKKGHAAFMEAILEER